MRHWIILAIVALLVGPIYAQDDAPLTADSVDTVTRVDAFGVEGQIAVGDVSNNSSVAYADVQIFAEVFNHDYDLIGEGIGFLVNACGEAVPFDFALQPGQSQRFAATLELFELEDEVARVSISAQGRPTDPAPDVTPEPVPGIVPVVRDDVALMEWVVTEPADDAPADAEPALSLRYGIGCDRDIFTIYDWYSYDLDADTITATEHPNAALVTDPDLRERINLADDALFQRSYLRFPPNSSRRMVYQDRINTLFTAEANGSFQRIIDEELFRSTLQGYIWLPEDRFMAYYFGGYGGGRKALVPGIAGAETIAHNHAMNLHPVEDRLDPAVRIGALAGNPVAEDMLEAARLCPCTGIINTVLNRAGAIAGVFAGELEAAHRAACTLARDLYAVAVERRADLAIAAAGPVRNMLQSHKALFNAYQALAPGGRLVFVAAAPEGFGGNQYEAWLRLGTPEAVIAELRKRAEINGQTALSTLEKAPHALFVTELEAEAVGLMGGRKARDLAHAIDRAREELAAAGVAQPHVLVMPSAAYSVPVPGH